MLAQLREVHIWETGLSNKNVVYQKKETLLLFTIFQCVQVDQLASLIMKNKSERSWDTEKLPEARFLKEKGARRMRTNKQVREVGSSLRLFFFFLLVTDKVESFHCKGVWSKERLPNHTVVRIAGEIERRKTFTSSSKIQTPKQGMGTTLPHGAGLDGSATSED